MRTQARGAVRRIAAFQCLEGSISLGNSPMTLVRARSRTKGKPGCALWGPSDGMTAMHRQIAGKLTGRVTKWIVLILWVLALGIFGAYAQKLADVQNNEASSWLPESAESTKALEQLTPFQNPDAIPTVVVYER